MNIFLFLKMLFRLGITVTSPKLPEDKRLCLFCHQFGDGVSDGPSRYILFCSSTR